MTNGLNSDQKNMIARLSAIKKIKPKKGTVLQNKRKVGQAKWEKEEAEEPDWEELYTVLRYAITHKIKEGKAYSLLINSKYAIEYVTTVLKCRDRNFEKWFEELVSTNPVNFNGNISIGSELALDCDKMNYMYGGSNLSYVQIMDKAQRWDGLFEAFKLSLRWLNTSYHPVTGTLYSVSEQWVGRLTSAKKLMEVLARFCNETDGSYDKLKECVMALFVEIKCCMKSVMPPDHFSMTDKVIYLGKFLDAIDSALAAVLRGKKIVFGIELSLEEESKFLDCYFDMFDILNCIIKNNENNPVEGEQPLRDISAVVSVMKNQAETLSNYLGYYKGEMWPALEERFAANKAYYKYRLTLTGSIMPVEMFENIVAEISEAYQTQLEFITAKGEDTRYHEEGHTGVRHIGEILNNYAAKVVEDRIECLERFYVTAKQITSFNQYVERIKSLKRMGHKIKNM